MPSSTVFTDMERDDGDSRPLHIAMEQLTVFGLEDAQLRRGLEAECPPSPPLPPSTAAAVAGGGGPVAGPLLLQGSPQGAAPCPCPCPCPAGPAGLPLVSSVLALFEAEQIQQQQQQQPRKKSVNMTECVPVPSSEHVAEIVGRQGKRGSVAFPPSIRLIKSFSPFCSKKISNQTRVHQLKSIPVMKQLI